jgi:hypothetical protein
MTSSRFAALRWPPPRRLGVESLWSYNQTVSGPSGQAWRRQMNFQYTF